MEAITEKTQYKFSKEAEWGCDKNDYTIPHELTVTITLNEYRQLLQQSAMAEVAKKNDQWLKEYTRANDLERRLKDTEALLREIQFGKCEANPSEEE